MLCDAVGCAVVCDGLGARAVLSALCRGLVGVAIGVACGWPAGCVGGLRWVVRVAARLAVRGCVEVVVPRGWDPRERGGSLLVPVAITTIAKTSTTTATTATSTPCTNRLGASHSRFACRPRVPGLIISPLRTGQAQRPARLSAPPDFSRWLNNRAIAGETRFQPVGQTLSHPVDQDRLPSRSRKAAAAAMYHEQDRNAPFFAKKSCPGLWRR